MPVDGTTGATTTTTNSSLAAASADLTQNTEDTIAFTKLQGKLNRALGFATAIAASEEAQGQAAKNRAEASKQLV
jgi:ABC-type uncharacterized transport system fused permease/ATPase subunit